MLKSIKLVLTAGLALILGITAGSAVLWAQSPPEKNQATLVIGLIPEQNIFKQLERYEPLAEYLSKRIGAAIKLKVLVRYGNIVDNFVSSQMDAAFFGSFTYCLAHVKLGVEAIARPVNSSGISTYHGLILVRKDSGIQTAQDMRGKRFAFVDKATTAGYLLPLAFFKENGIQDYKTYLKETYFAGTHQDAIYDVLNKKADVAAAKNTIFDRFAAQDPRIKQEMTVLGRSPDVPENGLAVKRDLNTNLKNRLKSTLLNMHQDNEGEKILRRFGARKFIPNTTEDYANVFKFAHIIGLNLTTYNYLND